MEQILMIIAALSIVAFVVGMFSPSTVKCSSRGKVALIYASAFILSGIIGATLTEQPEIKNDTKENEATNQISPQEVKILAKGDIISIPYSNKDIKIAFKDIKINRIPNNGLNLIFTLRIKNNSNEKAFISDINFKLLDAEKIEVEESGIYDYTFSDFMPSTFFFTTIEPNIGKEEQVGYSIKEEDYYLSINGHIMARIPIKSQK